MPAILEARGLVKKFGQLVAVNEVDVSLAEGEILAVLGPNGAGKTTTCEILTGLQKPDAGEVTICGHSLRNERRQILSLIGVQLQETQLYKRYTVRETLQLFASFYEDPMSVDDVLEHLDLHSKADEKLMNLSGGQKQRVYLGCAIVNKPKLLFLDEPTTGLDPQSRRSTWKIIESLRDSGRSILLTTHYMEEAEYLADQVSVIDQGKVIANGSPDELIREHCGGQIIELGFPDAEKAESAEKSVESLDITRDVKRIKNLITFETDKAMEVFSRLPEWVTKLAAKPTSINLRTSSLEDVFLHLTGRSMRDG